MQELYFCTFVMDQNFFFLLMSFLEIFVDTFVSFLKWEVIIISLRIENIVVLQMIIQRRKKREILISESSAVILIFNYS